MKNHGLLILFVVGAVASLVAAPLQDPGRGDGERLKNLFDKATGEIAALPGLTAAPTAELVSRSGVSIAQLKTLRRYEVHLQGELKPYRVALIDQELQGKTIRIGVASQATGKANVVHAFDDFGKVIPHIDPFLAQFRGPLGVGLTPLSVQPIGDVIALRDKVRTEDEPPKVKAEKPQWVLFRHHDMMLEMERRFGALRAAVQGEVGLRRPLQDLDDHVAELHAFATHLKEVMKPKTVGQYRKRLDQFRVDTTKAIDVFEAGNREAAVEIITSKMKPACSECHGWDANEFRKPLEGVIRDRRVEEGFGAGVFVVGIDVQAVDFIEEEAQGLASVIKAALLAVQ